MIVRAVRIRPKPAAPLFHAAPVILGTPTVGAPCSYTPGAADGYPAPTITRQWSLDGVDIVGAVNATYTPGSGDSGHLLTVREIATNTSGTATSTSAPGTVAISSGTAPAFTTQPALIGNPQVGVANSYTFGTVTGNPAPTVTRQWLLDGNPIVGANGTTYMPVAGDAGHQLAVRETASNGVGSPAVSTSPSKQVNAQPAFASPPSIVGTPFVGTATSYTPGTVTGVPIPTVTRQWTLDGANIVGATTVTYTPISGDVGHALAVRETADNAIGVPANSTSSGVTVATATAAPAFTSAPSITATPTVGVSCSYVRGTVTGSPAPSITQQWTLDGIDIVGATAATYTPISGDVGHALRVREIATNASGSANSTSAPSSVVGVPVGQTPGTVIQVGSTSLGAWQESERIGFKYSTETQGQADTRMNSGSFALDYSGGVMVGNRWSNVISGGHSGSMDDGRYDFDLDPSSPTYAKWTTVLPFSTDGHLLPPRACDTFGEWLIDATYPTRVRSNSPASQHSYWHNVAVGANVYNLMKYAAGNSSSGARQAHWMDSVTGQWARYGNGGAVAVNECYTFHDSIRKRFWRMSAVGNETKVEWISDSDPTATWTTLFMSNSFPMPCDIYSGGGYHPALDCFVVVSPHDFGPANTMRAFVLDMENISNGFHEISTSLSPGSAQIGYPATYCGLTYYPPKNCFIANDQGGDSKTLFYFTPTGIFSDPWVWSSETFTGTASPYDPALTGQYNRIGYVPATGAIAVIKAANAIPETFMPNIQNNWAATKLDLGVVVACDFSGAPANGGTYKWGSLSASPHVTCYQQNDAYYGTHVNVVTDVFPPGSTASLCWDVPDADHGQVFAFTTDRQGATSATIVGPYPDLTGADFLFADGSRRVVNLSSGTMTWTGALPTGTPITGGWAAVGERGDLWWISLDDYADQFGDNGEFWVQWRCRMDSVMATFPLLANGDTTLTSQKQLMIGEGMQSTAQGGTDELGMNPAWPFGYRGPGTSIVQNQIAGVRVDFEGETNVIALFAVDQWMARTAPYNVIMRAPSMYHGKPTYTSLTSSDLTWYTDQNHGVEVGSQANAAFRFQLDGNGIVNRNTGFVYPADEWYTMRVHVVLGTRGHGLSSIPVGYQNVPGQMLTTTTLALPNDTYTEHFRSDTVNPIWVRIRGTLTGQVDARITNKDTSTGHAILTLTNFTGPVNATEPLLVDEYENGFVKSTIEYYGARQGGAMQLLHRRGNIVMRVGNYVYDSTGYSGTAKYGTFAWTTFMTNKSKTQSHPTGKIWVSQIVIKSGPNPPLTPL